jgi:hypothetical protein
LSFHVQFRTPPAPLATSSQVGFLTSSGTNSALVLGLAGARKPVRISQRESVIRIRPKRQAMCETFSADTSATAEQDRGEGFETILQDIQFKKTCLPGAFTTIVGLPCSIRRKTVAFRDG